MKIIVCMKQVIDPEAPVSMFRIDEEKKQALPPEGSPPVLNPFDESALEAALRIKDEKGAEVVVVSMGRKLAKPLLQKTLAVGADEAILIKDEAFEDLDSYATAHILVQAIKKIGEYHLIFCGRQASDTNAGQVGIGIAELLDLPCITVARKIDVSADSVTVERTTYEGYEVIEAPIPAVVTVNSEIGDLRLAPVKAVMASRRKPLPAWGSGDLNLDLAGLKRTVLEDLFLAGPRGGRCLLVEGDNLKDAGERLALTLKEARIV